MAELFDELFKLFDKYDEDMTVYCERLEGEALTCDIEGHKKLTPEERQLLIKIKTILGKNWNQKLGKLYFQYKKIKTSGKGSFKFKYPDGSVYEVHSKKIVGDTQIGGKPALLEPEFNTNNKTYDFISNLKETNELLKQINSKLSYLTHQGLQYF